MPYAEIKGIAQRSHDEEPESYAERALERLLGLGRWLREQRWHRRWAARAFQVAESDTDADYDAVPITNAISDSDADRLLARKPLSFCRARSEDQATNSPGRSHAEHTSIAYRSWAFALLLACAASACSSEAPKVGPPPLICAGAIIPEYQLLYPIPNATAVPTGAGSLVFAGPLDANITVALAAPGKITEQLGTFVAPPSPLPSPRATPLPAPSGVPTPTSLGLVGVPYPTLAATTTYTVSSTFHSGGVCPSITMTVSSFTTQ